MICYPEEIVPFVQLPQENEYSLDIEFFAYKFHWFDGKWYDSFVEHKYYTFDSLLKIWSEFVQ